MPTVMTDSASATGATASWMVSERWNRGGWPNRDAELALIRPGSSLVGCGRLLVRRQRRTLDARVGGTGSAAPISTCILGVSMGGYKQLPDGMAPTSPKSAWPTTIISTVVLSS